MRHILKVTRLIQRKTTDLHIAALRAAVLRKHRTYWELDVAAEDAQERANDLLFQRNRAHDDAEAFEAVAEAEAKQIGRGDDTDAD